MTTSNKTNIMLGYPTVRWASFSKARDDWSINMDHAGNEWSTDVCRNNYRAPGIAEFKEKKRRWLFGNDKRSFLVCRNDKYGQTKIVDLTNAGKLAARVQFDWMSGRVQFYAPTWHTLRKWRTVEHFDAYTFNEYAPNEPWKYNGLLDLGAIDRDPEDDIPRLYFCRNGAWLFRVEDLSESEQEEHLATFEAVYVERGMVPMPGFMTAALMECKSMNAATLCLAAIQCINNKMIEDPNSVRGEVLANMYAYVPQWLWMLSCLPWWLDQEDDDHAVLRMRYCDEHDDYDDESGEGSKKALEWSAFVHRRDITHSTRYDQNDDDNTTVS
jgi:hypothetical protein